MRGGYHDTAIQIGRPERWQVAWTTESPLLPLLSGVGGGWLIALILLFYADPAGRRTAMAIATAIAALIAAYLIRTLPRESRGLAENPPDGTPRLLHVVRYLHREEQWETDAPAALTVEQRSIAESQRRIVETARLWVVTAEGERHPLSPYLAPEAVQPLQQALTRLLELPPEA